MWTRPIVSPCICVSFCLCLIVYLVCLVVRGIFSINVSASPYPERSFFLFLPVSAALSSRSACVWFCVSVVNLGQTLPPPRLCCFGSCVCLTVGVALTMMSRPALTGQRSRSAERSRTLQIWTEIIWNHFSIVTFIFKHPLFIYCDVKTRFKKKL